MAAAQEARIPLSTRSTFVKIARSDIPCACVLSLCAPPDGLSSERCVHLVDPVVVVRVSVFLLLLVSCPVFEEAFSQGRKRGLAEGEAYYRRLAEKTEEQKAQELQHWRERQQQTALTAQHHASEHAQAVSLLLEQQAELERQRQQLLAEQQQREEIERQKRETETAAEQVRQARVDSNLKKLQGEKFKLVRSDSELPCLSLRQQVLDCYATNPSNPLKCVSYVNELLSCAKSSQSRS